jgi:DNA-binding helix-hairpin-helix protein with protein kinase domain
VTNLVRYDAACRALAEAKSVDEVKGIRDKHEAIRYYAKQAKNRQLEIDASEIRIRAERRLGEMIVEQEKTMGLNTGRAGMGR